MASATPQVDHVRTLCERLVSYRAATSPGRRSRWRQSGPTYGSDPSPIPRAPTYMLGPMLRGRIPPGMRASMGRW